MSDSTAPLWGRVLLKTVGTERLERILAWMEGPQGDQRCPWTMPTVRSGPQRCRRKVGHQGLCATAQEVTNNQTGKCQTQVSYWHGVNYEVEWKP